MNQRTILALLAAILIIAALLFWINREAPEPLPAYDKDAYTTRIRQQQDSIAHYRNQATLAKMEANYYKDKADSLQKVRTTKIKPKHEGIKNTPAPDADSLQRLLSNVRSLYPD